MTAPVTISVRDLDLDYEISEDRRAALRERLVKHKGTGRRVVRALRGVTFDARAGDSVGIIGSNGSGKSTLLAAVAGLLPPTAGDILVSAEPKLLGVGATLLPAATGWKNIRIGCMALGMTADEVEEQIAEHRRFHRSRRSSRPPVAHLLFGNAGSAALCGCHLDAAGDLANR